MVLDRLLPFLGNTVFLRRTFGAVRFRHFKKTGTQQGVNDAFSKLVRLDRPAIFISSAIECGFLQLLRYSKLFGGQ